MNEWFWPADERVLVKWRESRRAARGECSWKGGDGEREEGGDDGRWLSDDLVDSGAADSSASEPKTSLGDLLDFVNSPAIPDPGDSVPSAIYSAEFDRPLRRFVDSGIDFPHSALHHTLETPFAPFAVSIGLNNKIHFRSTLVQADEYSRKRMITVGSWSRGVLRGIHLQVND